MKIDQDFETRSLQRIPLRQAAQRQPAHEEGTPDGRLRQPHRRRRVRLEPLRDDSGGPQSGKLPSGLAELSVRLSVRFLL